MAEGIRYGIVILAAGASTRLGQPKQLLPYKDKTLLTHIIDVSVASNAEEVIVVLGAHSDLILKALSNYKKVHIVLNAHWPEGISSSIHGGLKALQQKAPACEGVIFLVCDQPFVNTALLIHLVNEQQKTAQPIIGCSYGDTVGTPVLFCKELFTELYLLKGDAGAKKILQKHSHLVATIPFPEGLLDIDTITDYEKLKEIQR